ncbi:RNA polymerase subunit sigma-70 [Rhizobium ruizarguesonis]|nr:RNA polymerase subunit sigma-70 [Rhizobium leguminosarum]
MENQKRTPGRPPHTPSSTNRRVVELLASRGIPQAQICSVLGISQKTLRRRYGAELRRGASMLEAALVLRLFSLANGKGAVALKAVIFSLRARFGWSLYLPPPH